MLISYILKKLTNWHDHDDECKRNHINKIIINNYKFFYIGMCCVGVGGVKVGWSLVQWHTISKTQNNPDEYCVQKTENVKTVRIMSP